MHSYSYKTVLLGHGAHGEGRFTIQVQLQRRRALAHTAVLTDPLVGVLPEDVLLLPERQLDLRDLLHLLDLGGRLATRLDLSLPQLEGSKLLVLVELSPGLIRLLR